MSKVIQSTTVPNVTKKRSFTIHYRQGSLPPLVKHFEFIGTLPQAIVRAKEHCKVMGYKFVMVRPYFVDLAQQEALKLGNETWTEDQEMPEVAAIP